MEDSVFTYVFKAEVLIVTPNDLNQEPTEFKNVILLYPSKIQAMVYSQCENIGANKSGSGLGCHPTADYGAA